MLISCPPTTAPAKIVQYLNGRSSIIFQEEFNQLKKMYLVQYLWGQDIFVEHLEQ